MSLASLKNTTAGLATAMTPPNGAASNALRLAAARSKHAKEWATANPGKTAALGASAVLVAAPMLVAAPILGVVGFGANGIIAGSMAAGAQSGIGSVLAPSLFATLQSAGAAGYGVAAVSAAVQGVGGVAASVAGVAAFLKRGKTTEEDNEDLNAEEDKKDSGDAPAKL